MFVVLGTSTPAFGQGSAGMSMPFGSPGTPGFGAVGASQFGTIHIAEKLNCFLTENLE